ncbi:MAG: sulfatase-like hydrolase/transferase [Flavobacteriales bacterium]|nr:sulfatase-like hydrolase/transferase [Flavobacteriales bacterium]
MGRYTGHVRSLLWRLGTVLALFTAIRWVFLAVHSGAFPHVSLADAVQVFVQGLRFDAMTIVVANAPFILLSVLPIPWRVSRWYRTLLFALFIVVNGSLLFLCCMDLPLYGFTGKRITRDVLGQAAAGLRELPDTMLRYWWATACFAVSMTFLVVAWRRIIQPAPGSLVPWWRESAVSLPVLGLLFLCGRGGWQYQGLSPAHAADHVDVAFAPLVTNSAFTFGYSLSGPSLVPRRYMSTEEMDRLAPLGYSLQRDSADRRRNVVILIVESLGREYLSAISSETPYMPFLDSLCARSLVFTNAFANAEGSNKGNCAILAGIPSFTDDAFMNTAYADNKVEGLGTRLKELGYSTAYFHGGLNGEFKFDSFSKACGFDRYYGKDEFGNDDFYDGHWGVYDEEFLQFAAERMSEMPQPFCTAFFTLTTHDPFPIPARYKGRFPKGTQAIHEALGYADMSIRRFFERASREAWYANTLFVITADHTFKYNQHPQWYHNPAGQFAVPILFFTPDGSLNGTDPRVAQQLDILPSVLDFVGYDGRISTFGQSLLRRDRPNRAAIHLGGLYQLIQDDRMLLFDGQRIKGLYDYRIDTLFAHDLATTETATAEALEQELKALIQRHYEGLVNNTLTER